MTDQVANEFSELAQVGGNFAIAPAHGVAAIALSMAMKYHDINTVQDGTLYQQYKLEGRNMRDLSISDVFETAMRIEVHLIGASDRIAALIIDAVSIAVEDDPEGSVEDDAND